MRRGQQQVNENILTIENYLIGNRDPPEVAMYFGSGIYGAVFSYCFKHSLQKFKACLKQKAMKI